MKIAGPLFLLALLVLMSPVAAAQDEEEVSRLRSEVRQLRDLVKELTVDLVQVKARVRDLEKRLAEVEGGSGDLVGEAVPDVPTEEDGGEGTRNTAFAGTYRGDPAATQEEYIKWRLSELPEEEREGARAGIAEEARDELGEFRIEMTLYSDGKVTVMSETMVTVTGITGRWSSDGNQVALTFTHEDGVEKEDPESAAGEISDNLLLLKSEDLPFYLVLEKGNDFGVDEEAPADDPLPEEGPDVAPPTPEEPGGTAGTYVLDKEKMLPVFDAMFLEQMEAALEGMTEEEQAAAIAQAKAQASALLDRMNFEVLLSDDGSFTVAGEGVSAKGTWEIDGAKITFTTLMESGVEQDPPDVNVGRIVDGDIYFKPDDSMPFEMVLTRK